MICIKIHRSYRDVVALCDSTLLGKKFTQGNKQLDLRENFYHEKDLTQEQAISIIQQEAKEDATFNIVGPESIQAAKQAGIIDDEGVLEIENIPYALVLM